MAYILWYICGIYSMAYFKKGKVNAGMNKTDKVSEMFYGIFLKRFMAKCAAVR